MIKIQKFYILLFFLFSGFLCFWNLGANTLTNWDEAWYADIIRNMVSTGNYITPMWNKETFFDKPPLYFWLSVPIFKIIGISEFSSRFISSLAAFFTGIIVYYLGKILFNSRVGIISFIVLNSTIAFLYRSRTGNLDSLLTLFIILSIFSFYKGLKENNKWFLVMGLSVGLGFLTKGAISLFFPILSFLYLIFTKEFQKIKSKFFITGVLLAFTIIFSWITLSVLINGQEFISGFLENQTGKVSSTYYFWNNLSFEYISYLKSGLKFWFIFFIPSFIFVLYKFKKKEILVFWAFFILFFISLFFSDNKSNWFLMPLYPVVAIMIGFFLENVQAKLFSKNFFLFLFLCFIFAVFLDIKYKNEFIVPDIAINEKNVALAAKNITKNNESIYLTNYYYPTVIYYSERKVYAVYSDHLKNSWWIKPKTDWAKILAKDNVIIITSEAELYDLKNSFNQYTFKVEYKSGDKILVRKI